ncbi:pyruvate:ferredoxin (flavodoxin) oxidoreductase [bacterium]|nr:pyruvate:ferredoxin (flavodoxin) oxidoreductase [bacterium]
MSRRMITIDGNTAVANVAHATNEVIAIYPITPSSGMGEESDERSAKGLKNIWGTIPHVAEMQSEGGAAGAVHGALSTGALSTTFTASQGLLLMIPNMFKIAGELTPTVFHVSARALASHALSIFGDHSDVMAVRSTGFGLIASGSVQEAHDFALITQAATLESRIPFIHFFDGFRTTHEVAKIEELTFDDMRAMIDDRFVMEHRGRALTPDRPTMKGTAQNPDVFFQGRETGNKYYNAAPAIVQKCMDKFAKLTGRQYKLFEYYGAPDAERVIITMASSTETVHETVDYLVSKGEKVGLIKARLYRPFDSKALVDALPATVKSIACLDRTKEPGAIGEPLYIDVRTALGEVMSTGECHIKKYPKIVGGRYGLGSKDFTPSMVKAVFDNLSLEKPKNHFTVGITDDVTGTSLDYDPSFSIVEKGFNAMFYGLGADGTVGANKNTIKIIGESTNNYAQGYFVYDSRKAGTITTSHVRFGPMIIRKPYLIDHANFVACHNFSFLEKYEMLDTIVEGGTFLLNSPYGPDEVWDKLPVEVQQKIIGKKLKFWVVDGVDLGMKLGLGARINMIMQTAFFVISQVIPEEEAITLIKEAIKKTYGKKGEKVVQMNYKAVDTAKENVFRVKYPDKVTSTVKRPPIVPLHAPEFVQKVTAAIISGNGDTLPVSAMPVDGTFPTATTQYEKRNIAVQIPEWDVDTCIQCGQCSLVCPHAAIRIKAYDPAVLSKAPADFKSAEAKGPQFKGMKFTVQVAPEDCTGCGLCVWNCPAAQKDADGNKTDRKAINMVSQFEIRKREADNFDFFLDIPETDPSHYKRDTVKGSQLIRPLFEFSGACAGCGETPYVKLMSQLFGDHVIIANATGCSSIYGGNLPTTPYAKRADGRGPAWSNSLFEDNAEFGFGYRLTLDKFKEQAGEYLQKAVEEGLVDKAIADRITGQDQSSQEGIEAQRAHVDELRKALEPKKDSSSTAAQLTNLADYLVRKSVWVLGGDGWAYDIGYGGLDHVVASGRNVNILVLDTEVYSNTGGQMSKSTPRGATAKFAASGKPMAKKDLGMMAMIYGNVYVAKVSMGANPNQVVRAFAEADSYDGPSLIIAYSHCINHGINMTEGLNEQKKAVASGHWPLYRFDPRLADEGKNPLQIDSKEPTISFADYAFGENRYMVLKKMNPAHAEELSKLAQKDVDQSQRMYRSLAAVPYEKKE